MMHTHRGRKSRRSLHKMISSKKNQTFSIYLLPLVKLIWIFDEDNKWYNIHIKDAEDHLVICRRHNKGESLKFAYACMRMATIDTADSEFLSDEFSGILQNVENIQEVTPDQ